MGRSGKHSKLKQSGSVARSKVIAENDINQVGLLKREPIKRKVSPKRNVVERNDSLILTPLSKAPIYKKSAVIKAVRAIGGEKVKTVLPDGRVETVNTANDGDWIVTNPSGEKYIVPGEKFSRKYEKADRDGVFEAKGHVKAIANPFGKPISLEASWGELQHGENDCIIAASCDKNGNIDSDPYIIDLAAFKETYLLAEEESL